MLICKHTVNLPVTMNALQRSSCAVVYKQFMVVVYRSRYLLIHELVDQVSCVLLSVDGVQDIDYSGSRVAGY